MKYLQYAAALAVAAIVGLSGCERKVTEEVTKIVPAGKAQYVGSEACEACHPDIYASFRRTGHPYKLNDADSAQLTIGQYLPFTSVPNPPDVEWSDISLVIGGFWWKARYIDNEGYVLTGDNRQYNFETQEFVSYDAAKAPRKPYACGPCHMTAYKDVGNQDGLPGLVGTWEFKGIQCEECHGPGEIHAADPYEVDLLVDRSSEGCGKCHVRGAVNKIPASGGFIRHHEQWNEMFTTKHAALECVDCHDPHVGLHPAATERDLAIKLTCENCHLAETESFTNTTISEHLTSPLAPTCIDCHMPKAAKSAVTTAPYVGDVSSHLWRINTDSTAEMFTADGKFANGYLTLEFTCLQCHPGDTKQWAAEYAHDVHVASPAGKKPDVAVRD